MNKKRRAVIAANEISELKTYSLGGYNQKVLVEGKYKENPIVIFLHGGPGFPIPFGEGCRGMFPEITDRFIMVYWDQLGCGINNYKIDDSFTVERYVDMTVDLIRSIKEDFPQNTISLFGVSWGSVLAAKVALRVPDLIYRVMIYGQVLKQLVFNEEVVKVLESSNMSPKQKKQLQSIINNDEHTIHNMKSVTRWIRKYTEGYQAKNGGKAPLGSIIWGMLNSPDYSFKDFRAVVINGSLKNKSLLIELLDIDLSEVIRKIQVPYRILQGDTDIVTSTQMISAYAKAVDNVNVSFHRITNSGHMPSNVAMDYIIKEGFDFLDSRKASCNG